jgi:hypothetical protein
MYLKWSRLLVILVFLVLKLVKYIIKKDSSIRNYQLYKGVLINFDKRLCEHF